ncbi:RDD family protein [Candidatus Parcubacteria bacterium]|nr:RDD family protein [Candidatus Parcubacteria bacterium]
MEQTASVRYVGFWARLAARFVDGLIVGAALLLANIIIVAIAGAHPRVPVAPIVDIVIGLGYFCYMTKSYGATIGKRIVGAEVVPEHGGDLTWMTVVMREVLGKIVSSAIINIGYLMVAFTARKQGLHDKIAQTLVVYKDPSRDTKKLVTTLNSILIAFIVLGIVAGVYAGLRAR